MRAKEVRHGGRRAKVEPVAICGVRHALVVLGAVRHTGVAVGVAESVVALAIICHVVEVEVGGRAFFFEVVAVLKTDIVFVALGRVRRESPRTVAVWLARVAQIRAEVAGSIGYGVAARHGVVLIEVLAIRTVQWLGGQ